MEKTFRAALIAAPLALGLATVAPAAASTNPVFGHAKAVALTTAQAKNVTGKGTYSVYYGYYGNYFANLASYYGNLSLYYDGAGYSSSYTYWYTAYYYATYAATYYYNAYYYKVNGNR